MLLWHGRSFCCPNHTSLDSHLCHPLSLAPAAFTPLRTGLPCRLQRTLWEHPSQFPQANRKLRTPQIPECIPVPFPIFPKPDQPIIEQGKSPHPSVWPEAWTMRSSCAQQLRCHKSGFVRILVPLEFHSNEPSKSSSQFSPFEPSAFQKIFVLQGRFAQWNGTESGHLSKLGPVGFVAGGDVKNNTILENMLGAVHTSHCCHGSQSQHGDTVRCTFANLPVVAGVLCDNTGQNFSCNSAAAAATLPPLMPLMPACQRTLSVSLCCCLAMISCPNRCCWTC